jgi:hypothetical protein
MQSRRFFAVATVLVGFLLMLPPAIAFGSGVDVAVLPWPKIVVPGEVFDLDLSIPVAGDSLNGYETTITYDTSLLTFIQLSPVSLQEGPLMVEACPTGRWHQFSATSGIITISHVLLCAGEFITGPGVLYRLRFQAGPVSANTEVVIQSMDVYRAGYYVSPVRTTNGLVRISSTTGVDEGEGSGEIRFGLLSAFPNPTRGSTRIDFTLQHGGAVDLAVYSVRGARLQTLFEGYLEAHVRCSRAWDGRDGTARSVPAGVYWIRLDTGEEIATRPIILIR